MQSKSEVNQRMRFILYLKVSDTATGQKLQFNQVGKFSFRCEHTMMKGYLNNPEATAQAIDSEGFYSPGDIGYITEKGFLYITGRISDLMLVFSQLVKFTFFIFLNSLKGFSY